MSNTEAPLISVVIPTYNSWRTLEDAIESVLRQSFTDFEVLVVDDGSSDGTAAKLKRTDQRVFYIYQRNSGPEAARNTGVRFARGEFIAFLDGDDVWAPGKIASQLTAFAGHSDAWLVCAQSTAFSDHWQPPTAQGEITQAVLSLPEVYVRNPISTSTVMVRARCLRQVGAFRPGIRSEDWDLWMRIARHGKIVKLEHPLTGQRVHATNRSSNVEKELPWALKVLDDNFSQLPQTHRNHRLHRQANALVYLAFSRLYHEQSRFADALRLLWKSVAAWPFGFPAVAMRACCERLRYAARVCLDSVLAPAHKRFE